MAVVTFGPCLWWRRKPGRVAGFLLAFCLKDVSSKRPGIFLRLLFFERMV
jgi:hypothetical protein